MDITNLGAYASIDALWAAHPEGGKEGDYCTISGVKYRWNKYDCIWENAETVTESPAHVADSVDDLVVQNDLYVGGKIKGDIELVDLKGGEVIKANAEAAQASATKAETKAQEASVSAAAIQTALNNLIVGDDIPAATVAQAASTAADVSQIKTSYYQNQQTYTNIAFESEDGYYPCTAGVAVPDKILISGYCCAVITNLTVGETYEIKCKSGNTSKILNYYKNGVCVSRSSESGNTEKTYNIVVDATYDTIVINSSKGDNPYIHKITTVTKTVKDLLDAYKTETNSQIYKEVTDVSYATYTKGGFYVCEVGSALPAITENESCYYVVISNVRTGEVFDITGESGKSSKIWNKFKDGVCIARSSEGSMATKTYQVTADGTFDTLVLNSYTTVPTAKRTYTRTLGIGDAVDAKLTAMQTEINSVKNTIKTGLEGKNVVVIGDSSVCGGDNNNQWANKLSDVLGVNVKVFAKKGFTIRYNTSGCLATSMNVSFMSWVEEGNTPDIIILQMGGNDLPRMSTNGGSVTEAFAQYNYVSLKNSEMTASSLRYHLELWRRKFPKAIIVVGTVLQRAGATDNTQELAEIQRGIASRLGMYVADCNKEVGFSLYTEASTTNRYKDSTDAVSRTNPYFNYINDATGEVVTQEVATTDGVLNEGYSKRYGLYTYDGTHMIQRGEDVMTRYYANKLISIARFIIADTQNNN